MNTKIQPNIFDYHDCKKYLRDWVVYQKSCDPQFSLRKLAKESGVSAGYLPLVLGGKRTFTKRSSVKIIEKLKLSKREARYFELLRVISEEPNPENKIQALREIKKSSMNPLLDKNQLESYKYLSNWVNVAIREMTSLNGFKWNAKWIQAQLVIKLPLSVIVESMALLKELKIVTVKKGKVSQPKKPIYCTDGIYKLSMSQFHTQMMEQAVVSIYETPPEKRNILGQALAIHPSDFDKVKDIMNEAVEKIQKIADQDSPSEVVYYVAHLAFPLTKIEGEK